MPASPDHQHHVRRIVLPSGKTIEVVYFEDTSKAPATPAEDLHVCPECASELVHPVAWEEEGSAQWHVTLRCPNCEWRGSGVHSQDDLDRFDALLDSGTHDLLRDLQHLVRANMEDGIERWVTALGADQIVPDDF